MSQDATKKELRELLSALRDTVIGYEHMAEAWGKIQKLTPGNTTSMDESRKRSKAFAGMHDTLEEASQDPTVPEALINEHSQDARLTLPIYLKESIAAVDIAIDAFNPHIALEGVDGALRSFRTAKLKFESAAKTLEPKDTGRTVH